MYLRKKYFQPAFLAVGIGFGQTYLKATKDYRITAFCQQCGFYSKIGAGCEIKIVTSKEAWPWVALTFTVFAYVVTREQFPSCDVMEEAIEVLTDCGIPRRNLVYHDQTDCPMCWKRELNLLFNDGWSCINIDVSLIKKEKNRSKFISSNPELLSRE